MFSFFFSFIFFLLFIILMVAFGVLSFVSRLFFGKRRTSTSPNYQSEKTSTNEESASSSFFGRRKTKKKIFDSNDGEYIDYVEVKE